MEKQYEKYFLASNSCEGFVSHFGDSFSAADGWRAVIIKGGPGTGKSSFMRRMAAYAQDKGYTCILCPCSSDPQSLDAVIIKEIKTVFLDGTAPHVVEPGYPGVCEEIVNLGQFWDSEDLKRNAQQIILLTNQNKRLQKAVSGYMAVVGGLMLDNLKIAQSFIDVKKAENYGAKLANRYIPINKGEKGTEQIRFLTGITPKGIVSYPKTVTEFYKNVVVISDKYLLSSSAIMKRVRDIALARGFDIINVKNSFLPSTITDHIIIPKLSLAFVTENDFIHFDTDVRRVHSRRFCDVSALKAVRNKLLFNKRIIRELLQEACDNSKNAKFVHDALEKYYVDAMDFKALSGFAPIVAEKYIK